MQNKAHWAWLSAALGQGARCREALEYFGSPENILGSDLQTLRMSGVLTPRQIEKIEKTKITEGENAVKNAVKNGWQILTPEDDDYPELLSKIDDLPLVLYVWGSLEGINSSLCFGIVGTRNPSPDSVTVARTISAQLSEAGAVIVSGGALGIDSAAHEGALRAGGKTVAVLGCGLGTRYLMQSAAMRSEISKTGAVISEFPPFSPASRTSFPIRNRIISGMSRGVLVVEAGERSGSIITANRALDQGRDVFAVPGNIVTSAYVGANKLIRDGAAAVTCAEDIIDEYEELYPGKVKAPAKETVILDTPAKTSVTKKSAALLSDTEKKVYEQFGSEPLYPGDIASAASLTLSEVNTALTTLEINDYIASVSGGRFSLI